MMHASRDRVPADASHVIAVLRGVERVTASPGAPALVDLEVPSAFVTALVDAGSGAAARLGRLAAGLEPAEPGRVAIGGVDLTSVPRPAIGSFLRGNVGYLFEDLRLHPDATVDANVELPFALDGRTPTEGERAELDDLCASLALGAVRRAPVGELPVALQLRVAIARAFAVRPRFVFAHEPARSLDERDRRVSLALLRTLAHERGTGVLVATSDPVVASLADRQIVVSRTGGVVEETRFAPEAHLRSVLAAA